MSWTEVKSSNIREVEYLEDLRRLNVRFQDRSIYSYENVTPEQYDGLIAAESKGKYLRSHIVNRDAASASPGPRLVPAESSGAAIAAERLTLFVPDDCCVAPLQRELRSMPALCWWECGNCGTAWKLDISGECPIWKPEVCMEVFKI